MNKNKAKDWMMTAGLSSRSLLVKLKDVYSSERACLLDKDQICPYKVAIEGFKSPWEGRETVSGEK